MKKMFFALTGLFLITGCGSSSDDPGKNPTEPEFTITCPDHEAPYQGDVRRVKVVVDTPGYTWDVVMSSKTFSYKIVSSTEFDVYLPYNYFPNEVYCGFSVVIHHGDVKWTEEYFGITQGVDPESHFLNYAGGYPEQYRRYLATWEKEALAVTLENYGELKAWLTSLEHRKKDPAVQDHVYYNIRDMEKFLPGTSWTRGNFYVRFSGDHDENFANGRFTFTSIETQNINTDYHASVDFKVEQNQVIMYMIANEGNEDFPKLMKDKYNCILKK